MEREPETDQTKDSTYLQSYRTINTDPNMDDMSRILNKTTLPTYHTKLQMI